MHVCSDELNILFSEIKYLRIVKRLGNIIKCWIKDGMSLPWTVIPRRKKVERGVHIS
jgi:hypothetical protein